jgi:hypothetical protein
MCANEAQENYDENSMPTGGSNLAGSPCQEGTDKVRCQELEKGE